MSPSTGTKATFLLQWIAYLLFATAVLAFVFGGGLIHAVRGTDRMLAEIEGFALTLLCAGLGVLARAAEDRLEEGEANGPKSLGDALRK